MTQLRTAVKAISVVTLGEMRAGAILAKWGEARRRALESYLRGYLVIPIDSEVADEWASLRARCAELGRPKRDNDLWVAATARRHGLLIASLDRDHADIPGVTLIQTDGSEVSIPA